jgi:hypothetical protein
MADISGNWDFHRWCPGERLIITNVGAPGALEEAVILLDNGVEVPINGLYNAATNAISFNDARQPAKRSTSASTPDASWSRTSRAASGRRRRPCTWLRPLSSAATTGAARRRRSAGVVGGVAGGASGRRRGPGRGSVGADLRRAISRRDGLAIVDTAPGDQRLLESAVALADAVVFPTRAGGVEYSPAHLTLDDVPSGTRRGIVICSPARASSASTRSRTCRVQATPTSALS